MKVYGTKECYVHVRQDVSRIIISYGYVPEDDGINATWHETIFYKKQHPHLTIEEVKKAVVSDVNAETEEKILSGFVWNDKPVWLSSDYQFDFKAAYDLAVQTKGKSLPIKFKLGENAESEPVYHTFEDMVEFTDFYTKAIAFINQCLNEGWEIKDSIDWSDYEVFFPVTNV